jgi:hypothetical protein
MPFGGVLMAFPVCGIGFLRQAGRLWRIGNIEANRPINYCC